MKGYETALLIKEIISYGFKNPESIIEYLKTKGFLKGLNDFYSWEKKLIKIFLYENKTFKEVSG